MRLFLDTNVLVSALTTPGVCLEVLETAITWHTLVISPPVMKELYRVLTKKLRAPPALGRNAVSLLRRCGEMAPACTPLKLPHVDPADAAILASAAAGKADFFVTGDKELLVIQDIQAMQIRSPREIKLLLHTYGWP